MDRGDKTFSTSSNLGGAGYGCNQAMFIGFRRWRWTVGIRPSLSPLTSGVRGTDVIRQCLLVSDTGGRPWG